MNATLSRWMRQPTTIQGIAVLLGAAFGVGAYLGTHGNMAVATGVGGGVAGIVLTLMQDNSADRSSLEGMVGDMIAAAAQRRLTPAVMADLATLLTPHATTTTTTTTTQAPPAPTPVVVVPSAVA